MKAGVELATRKKGQRGCHDARDMFIGSLPLDLWIWYRGGFSRDKAELNLNFETCASRESIELWSCLVFTCKIGGGYAPQPFYTSTATGSS